MIESILLILSGLFLSLLTLIAIFLTIDVWTDGNNEPFAIFVKSIMSIFCSAMIYCNIMLWINIISIIIGD